MTQSNVALGRFFASAVQRGVLTNRRRGEFYLSGIFDGVDFAGVSVLDVGGGRGLHSFYAFALGAQRVVCLEPEIDGSSAGMADTFQALRADLGAGARVQLERATLQAYTGPGPFDVIVLHNSINHLDEEACVHLLEGEPYTRSYRAMFEKLAALSTAGTSLVVCDCARRNFFGMLGLRSPFASSVDWEKHQAPEIWARLLAEAGFRTEAIQWHSPNVLGRAGRLVLGNKVGSFFAASHFCLRMRFGSSARRDKGASQSRSRQTVR